MVKGRKKHKKANKHKLSNYLATSTVQKIDRNNRKGEDNR